ncbi:MAG: ribosome biogenesis GTP-binding protein YihA/YsxC [Nitrospirota bacterium]
MKILTAEFVRSCLKPEQFPREPLREVALVGRSNVGKSSLLNSLLHRRGLAKVSRTPGKTRAVNFFLVTTDDPQVRRFYLVDLPGYGYAKAPKSVRISWGPLIERYLADRPQLRGVFQLVDARRIEPQDRDTFQWLLGTAGTPVLVATKVDKLSRTQRSTSLAAMREIFGAAARLGPIPYSSITHEGREELWAAIRTMLVASSGERLEARGER